MKIRKASDIDIESYVQMTEELSRFNRENHLEQSKYDNYDKVLESIKKSAIKTFETRGKNTLILVVEDNEEIIGYALGRIYNENSFADNGTGAMGLFDELYLDKRARGKGLGQKLIDEVMDWFKKNGINRVKLHAYSWNSNAKKLYEKNGFNEYTASYEKFL